MNILLIDDEVLELDQLEHLLKPHFPNHNFYRAHDPSEAYKIMATYTIQLALVDIHLPGGSGLDIAKRLKEDSNTTVIMVTAFQSFEYAQEALRIKVDNYITKPVVEKELVDMLRPFFHGRSYSEIVLQTLESIHQNYRKKITLLEIADDIHVNHAYLSRKFNSEVGISFPNYLNNYRIEAAKRMIEENTYHSIAQIAERCGFNGQHYFSTLFKKVVGMKPSEYKKETLL